MNLKIENLEKNDKKKNTNLLNEPAKESQFQETSMSLMSIESQNLIQ